jgi:glycosyltransferase involved in cell wall biosynthesis
LVTVAIPTYRRPEMLRQAIESALAQTYRNIEVLVSDSAADPEIAALVAGYGDPRLRYRNNGETTDMVTNAGAMFMAATGDLIGTLDDDDMWEPDFLERLVPPFTADPEVVVAFADHSFIDAQGKPFDGDRTLPSDFSNGPRQDLRPGLHQPFLELATSAWAIPMTVAAIFRRSAVDWSDWHHEARTCYDKWLAYLLARNGGAAWYEPRRLTRRRFHGGAETAAAHHAEAAVWVYDRWLADERLAPLRRDLHRAAAPSHIALAADHLYRGGADARHAASRHLRAAARGGASVKLMACWAFWPLPHPVRCGLIDTARRVYQRRGARRSRYPAAAVAVPSP